MKVWEIFTHDRSDEKFWNILCDLVLVSWRDFHALVKEKVLERRRRAGRVSESCSRVTAVPRQVQTLFQAERDGVRGSPRYAAPLLRKIPVQRNYSEPGDPEQRLAGCLRWEHFLYFSPAILKNCGDFTIYCKYRKRSHAVFNVNDSSQLPSFDWSGSHFHMRNFATNKTDPSLFFNRQPS